MIIWKHRKELRYEITLKTLAIQGLESNGGGALGSELRELVEFCHYEDERSEDVPIAKSLHIDEITTSHFANAPRNDINGHLERSERSQTDMVFSRFTSHFSRKPNPSQPCLGFALCSQSFTHVASQQCAQSVRYPDSLCSVRTQIRSLRKGRSKVAFTLAEVLITLGIIGVVAALTLPSVINNIKHKQLETAFKTAYSIFSQAVQNMKREDGEGLEKYYAYYDVENDIYPNSREFADKVYRYSSLKVIEKCNYNNNKIMNYTNDSIALGYGIHMGNQYLADEVMLRDELSNGMCSSFGVNAGRLFFIVDTNGTRKPNRLGHDVFWFKINSKDMLEPLKMRKLYTEEELEQQPYPTVSGAPCSTKSKQAGNGTGCGYYALVNQNPDDPTKSYWESLP